MLQITQALCDMLNSSNLNIKYFARPLNLAATKLAKRALNSGFFGPMNLRRKNKLLAFMNWTAVNVTSAWTWMNFYQVIRTEDVLKTSCICLFVNVCQFVLCIASWKLERLIAQ